MENYAMMNNFGNKKCHSVILSSRGSMLKQGKSVKVGQRKDFVWNFPRVRGAMQIIFLFMTSPSAILQVSALIYGKDVLRFFSSGKLASCDLHFTGVRKTTWFHTRLSFLCQNTILNARHRPIGMSKDLLDYPFCHDVNKYERMVKIGQGTFGFVDCFSPPFW